MKFKIQIQKLQLDLCAHFYYLSIGIVLLLLNCCVGFASPDGKWFDIAWLVTCPASHRVIVKGNQFNAYGVRSITTERDGCWLNFSPSDWSFVQCADDRWWGGQSPEWDNNQTFLIKDKKAKYFLCYPLSRDSTIAQKKIPIAAASDDNVIISRDGTKIVVTGKNSIQVFDVNKINACISAEASYTYTPDPDKLIIPESVSVNNGDCIDFMERADTDPVPYNPQPMFVSDDGTKKLQDKRFLYVKTANGWSDPINIIPNDEHFRDHPIQQIGYSNSLQYFVFCWRPIRFDVIWGETNYVGVFVYQYVAATNTIRYSRVEDKWIPCNQGDPAKLVYLYVIGVSNDDGAVLRWCPQV